ncbi:TonB-dependent receptor [Cellulophaga tyrosinoxydans]|uniref:CarboxypepD_reg-like domain-containing protein n=1 Tax=Cellulophaga tyrosinoxydans TaxID=504486 RepID=A0A1W1Z3T4_9FLAO|nr:TonB-dependent receptor [Cellulophaga tyrosinoxydans]SMC43089.1 CarboxypepD_reg-like domain-containing protein [Cellulophaga tyrosinoxydans]
MFKFLLFFFLFLGSNISFAQDIRSITGEIRDTSSKMPIAKVTLEIEGTTYICFTNANGEFLLQTPLIADYILNISFTDYRIKRIPISISGQDISLGVIYLEKDFALELNDNLISLTDTELLEDEIDTNPTGLLQATKDVFLQRAAFDFGQAFFRVKGYDSQYGKVLINGIEMNKMFDGRPQWNNWGGLNDVTRNQDFTSGLDASEYSYGGILGVTNINTKPSGMRPGTRLSTSASNRTYAGRLMATHTSKLNNKGFAYSVSGSRRWAKEGYMDGILYDAFSVFGALEYQFNTKSTLLFTGMLASNRRGRSSAITEEVFNLIGNRYNPYWGEQDGKIRNSRERKIAEPIVMLNYFWENNGVKINAGISYQSGINSRSRLGYYNAPNPDPTYYRYLPSFYINSPIGANFLSANTAKDGFLNNPQINWNQIYNANRDNIAAYVLYDDVTKDNQIAANVLFNAKINNAIRLDAGVNFQNLMSNNYAEINDLLGATYHEDLDTFSNTLNDVNGSREKLEGDVFNYNYTINGQKSAIFSQLVYEENKWNAFLSGSYSTTNYSRNGAFLNERFLDDSYGESIPIRFNDVGLKGGINYKINGRNWIAVNTSLQHKPPTVQNIFINPRENNQIVSNSKSEKVTATEISYYLRYPKLTGRVSTFYTRFQDVTDINFFFVDAGIGSDFVQEVLTDLDKLHLGAEIGLEYQLSSSVQLSAVANIGKYVYASNPNVVINFDTAGAEDDLINLEGNVDLGASYIKDYKLAQGPQKAFAFGINYRDPKYWWVGLTANYLANNYTNIATITRTNSFYIDPETGLQFPDATTENVAQLLQQKPLDNFYLLNVVGGKSWLKTGKYISVFISVNNVFDTVFKSGGYEQSRNGNYGQLKQDNLSGTPTFAPKYWYGYGRTYFLNLAISF